MAEMTGSGHGGLVNAEEATIWLPEQCGSALPGNNPGPAMAITLECVKDVDGGATQSG